MPNISNLLTIIYDSNCSLCCGCMEWIKLKAITKNSFRFVSCNSEKRVVQFPSVQKEDCFESIHVITSQKKVLKGDNAIPEIVARLKKYNKLAVFFKIPILSNILYIIYRCIAKNRYIISQTIYPLIDNK